MKEVDLSVLKNRDNKDAVWITGDSKGGNITTYNNQTTTAINIATNGLNQGSISTYAPNGINLTSITGSAAGNGVISVKTIQMVKTHSQGLTMGNVNTGIYLCLNNQGMNWPP